MGRKSSFRRFGKDFMSAPGPGEGLPEVEEPAEEPVEKEPAPRSGVSKFVTVVLFLLCAGLAIGLYLSVQDAAKARRRLRHGNDIGSLYLAGITQLREGDYTRARESLKTASDKAREYQSEGADSYVAALSAEIDATLKKPAIARGKLGARAQKWADLRKLVTELEPADIYLQLGEKSGPVLDEHVKRMDQDKLAQLMPEHIDRLVNKKLAELDEKELAKRLATKMDAVFQERLSNITISSLRGWLKDRLTELVRSEIARRRYDSDAMKELLGEHRIDVVRNFIEEAKIKELAGLLERRFDEIERAMAKKLLNRQARITLDDGTVWEGQILHEGPLDLRFMRKDGSIYSIPKSRIKKNGIERLLQPKDNGKKPEEPKEPEKDPGQGE